MDHDFYIELLAPDGLQSLAPLLGEMPFEILLERGDTAGLTLVQGAVSEFAGFSIAAPPRLDRHFYEASVRTSSAGDPEDVVRAMSLVFARAGFPHWIWLIEHELDEDELIVSEGHGLQPTSHRGTEPWSGRTQDF